MEDFNPKLQKTTPDRLSLVLAAGFLTLIIAAALLIPKGQDVLWINGHHSSTADNFFRYATEWGNGWIFLALLVVALGVRYSHATIILIAWIGHGLVSSILKRYLFPELQRPRGVLGDEVLHFIDGVKIHTHHTFPSGHTATAFCLALLAGLLYQRRGLTVALYILALMVGYSRVYLAQHFLVDVAAGAALGIAVAYLSWRLLPAFEKTSWGRKSLYRLPFNL